MTKLSVKRKLILFLSKCIYVLYDSKEYQNDKTVQSFIKSIKPEINYESIKP